MEQPGLRVHRLSAVSFFNTTPLVDGLDADPSIRLRFAVPSALIDDLVSGVSDVALLPVIDCQRMPGLRIVPAGGIGCDGPTLTVRLFSKIPIERTTVLAADTDSHTSVALARIIFDRAYGLRPKIIPLGEARGDDGEALLLIGDKVITAAPADRPFQLDLGEAWKTLTGLPFLFAVWTARAGVDLGDLPVRLAAARKRGLSRIDTLVDRFAVPRGWPREIAHQYLADYLKFAVGARQLQAMRLFHQMAYEVGALTAPPADLEVIDFAQTSIGDAG